MTTTIEKPHVTGSPSERFTSRDPDAFEIPTSKDEDWRFTPLARVRQFFEPFTPDGVIDGENTVPDGATVETVTPSELAAFGAALTPADRVSALAMAHAERGLHVRVDAGAQLSEPIVLRREGVSGKGYSHHVVEVGANAVATLVIDHAGTIQVAANIEFVLGDGSSLTVVSVNDAANDSVQLSSYAALGRARCDLPVRQRDPRRWRGACRADGALRRPGRHGRTARRHFRR